MKKRIIIYPSTSQLFQKQYFIWLFKNKNVIWTTKRLLDVPEIHGLHITSHDEISYIDDIAIFSKMKEKHENHINDIIKSWRRQSYRWSNDNSMWRQNEIKFLGFHISSKDVKLIDLLINTLLDLSVPTNAKALQEFIGTVTFYQWLTPKLSQQCLLFNNY